MVNTFRFTQKFTSSLNHISDYFELVNRFFSSWQLAVTTVNYYNLDIENSNVDKDIMNGGSYELTGDLSGWKWRKILMFQVNAIEALPTTATTAEENGVTKSDHVTSMYFPEIYEMVPHAHDFISFECLNTGSNYVRRTLPVYQVVNFEKSNDFELGFYKISCKSSSTTTKQLDQQLSGVYTLVDFEKQIYPIDQSIIIQELLNERTKNKLKSYFDQNCGLYCENLG